MLVRPATLDDAPAITEIYGHYVLHSTCTAEYVPPTLEQRASWLKDRLDQGYPVLVAEEGGEVIGWGALGPFHARTGYRFTVENSVYVGHDHHGRGVGKALLGALIDAARSGGYNSIIASIDSDNDPSIELHRRFGFVEVARYSQLIWKFDRWLDVIHMQLLLK